MKILEEPSASRTSSALRYRLRTARASTNACASALPAATGLLPAAPFANSTTMSFVLTSPSMSTMLNVSATTSVSAEARSSFSTFASVVK